MFFVSVLVCFLFFPFVFMNSFIILSMFLAVIGIAFDDVRDEVLEAKAERKDEGIAEEVRNAYCQQTIPLICAALRAATRLALSGTEGGADKIAKLRGNKRWAEGGVAAATQMETPSAAAA